MTGFKQKLRGMVRKLSLDAEVGFEIAVDNIGDFVRDSLRRGDVLNADLDSVRHLAQELRACCRWLDATEVLNTKVLKVKSARVIDIEVPPKCRKSPSEIKRFVHEANREGRMPSRGNVYVVWQRKPEKYWYVGRASREKRITNVNAHAKLFVALNNATMLSLLVPAQSRPKTVADLEAATLVVLEAVGKRPELNVRSEPVGASEGTKRMKELQSFFKRMAGEL